MKHISHFYKSIILFGFLSMGCVSNNDSVKVKGTITEIAPGYCGALCMGGMIEVKLSEKPSNYDSEYIYLVTACMSDDVKINAEVNVTATKLVPEDDACCYSNYSRLDTKGLEVYKLSELETAKIK